MSITSSLPPGAVGVLPGGTLLKVFNGRDVAGVRPIDYGLIGESINETAERSWTHLRGRWRQFQTELAELPEHDPAVGVTREYWLGRLFHELGFGRLAAAPAGSNRTGCVV